MISINIKKIYSKDTGLYKPTAFANGKQFNKSNAIIGLLTDIANHFCYKKLNSLKTYKDLPFGIATLPDGSHKFIELSVLALRTSLAYCGLELIQNDEFNYKIKRKL
jgi:hypothetical protein